MDPSILLQQIQATTLPAQHRSNPRQQVPMSAQLPQRPQGNFVCPLCNRCYAYRHGLTQHMQSHSGIKPFTCMECNKSFGRKFQLDRHLKVHQKARQTYQCPDCDQEFHMREAFLLHLTTHTKPDETPFLCETCSETFNSKSALIHHRRKYHPGKSLSPLNTSSGSSVVPSLSAQPIAVPTPAIPVQNLPISSSSVFQGSDGTRIMNYTASLTRLNNNNNANNTNNMGVMSMPSNVPLVVPHTPVRNNVTFTGPFPCYVCGKRFLDRYGLRRHFRTHSGERPHLCEVCGLSFIESSHKKQHMKTHSSEVLFHCQLCNRGFNRKYSYQRHMKWHDKSHSNTTGVGSSGHISQQQQTISGPHELNFSTIVNGTTSSSSGQMVDHMMRNTNQSNLLQPGTVMLHSDNGILKLSPGDSQHQSLFCTFTDKHQ